MSMPGRVSGSSPTSSAPLAAATTDPCRRSIRDAIVPPVLTTVIFLFISLPSQSSRVGLRQVVERDADAVGGAGDVQAHVVLRAVGIAHRDRLDQAVMLDRRLPAPVRPGHRQKLAFLE